METPKKPIVFALFIASDYAPRACDRNPLSSAVRDAEGFFEALYSSPLEVECQLLANEDATRERIKEELQKIAVRIHAQDTLVITFQGHASPIAGVGLRFWTIDWV